MKKRRMRARIRHLEHRLFQERVPDPPAYANVELVTHAGTVKVLSYPFLVGVDPVVIDVSGAGYRLIPARPQTAQPDFSSPNQSSGG